MNAEWERQLGRAAFGAILAAIALAVAGLVVAPGRIEVALLSVVLAVVVTARVAGFWASLVTTFVAAVMVDLGWLYPGSESAASRPLDLAALGVFGLVAVLTGRAVASAGASARTAGVAEAAGVGAVAGAAAVAAGSSSPSPGGAAAGWPGTSPSVVPAPFEPPAESLTAREVDVLALLAAGLSNDEIAEHLVVSPNTVKTHLSHAYAKLGATSRTAAVARARAVGLVGGGAVAPGVGAVVQGAQLAMPRDGLPGRRPLDRPGH